MPSLAATRRAIGYIDGGLDDGQMQLQSALSANDPKRLPAKLLLAEM